MLIYFFTTIVLVEDAKIVLLNKLTSVGGFLGLDCWLGGGVFSFLPLKACLGGTWVVIFSLLSFLFHC